jgi:hypothetical protein
VLALGTNMKRDVPISVYVITDETNPGISSFVTAPTCALPGATAYHDVDAAGASNRCHRTCSKQIVHPRRPVARI